MNTQPNNAVMNQSELNNLTCDIRTSDVAALVVQFGGNLWGECPQFGRDDWKYSVSNGDTLLGYWEWVMSESRARGESITATPADKLAVEITSDDVEHVLRSNSLKIANTDGKPFNLLAEEAFDTLNFFKIENAMLAAGPDLDRQKAASRTEIEKQMQDSGIIER